MAALAQPLEACKLIWTTVTETQPLALRQVISAMAMRRRLLLVLALALIPFVTSLFSTREQDLLLALQLQFSKTKM
jgi:hypothetical protein